MFSHLLLMVSTQYMPFAELFEVLYSPLTVQTKLTVFVDIDADATNIWTSPRLQKAAMTPEESVHYKLDTDAGGVEWASVLPHGQGVVFLNSTGTSSDSSHSLRSSTSAARNGNGKAPYRVAMFHQLDCLNVLREEMVLLLRTSTHTSTSPDPPATSSSTPTPHRAQFCLNYLRESILCHADSHLERVRSEFGPEFGPEYESVQKGNGNGKGRERGRARGRAVVLGTERTDCVDWEGVWRGVEENWGEVMREEGREG